MARNFRNLSGGQRSPGAEASSRPLAEMEPKKAALR
jgi:hypothetical protein